MLNISATFAIETGFLRWIFCQLFFYLHFHTNTLKNKEQRRGRMQKGKQQCPKNQIDQKKEKWVVYRHSESFSGGWCEYAYVCVRGPIFMCSYVQLVPCIYVLAVLVCVCVWRNVDNNNNMLQRQGEDHVCVCGSAAIKSYTDKKRVTPCYWIKSNPQIYSEL